MGGMWKLWATVGAVAAVAVGAAVIVGAIALRDGSDSGSNGGGSQVGNDTPDTHTPGSGPQDDFDSALHAARLDLAQRLQIEPADVTLRSIRPAGFDGCLGVYRPDEACTEQFIGGYIAIFEANGSEYRYHFGGERFEAADFQPAGTRIEDGLDVPKEIAPDLVTILANYARHDAEIREGASSHGTAVTESIVPFLCPEAADCAYETGSRGAVRISVAGKELVYVAAPGETPPLTITNELPEWANEQVEELQQRLREDLAGRLQVDAGMISVRSFRWVTWNDGCLGVFHPDRVCTQALVDGWDAKLAAGGKLYSYHGAGDGDSGAEWIAATFEEGATVADGFPRGAFD